MNQSEPSHSTAPSKALSGATMGSVGLLLQMTGHERDVAVGLAIAVAVNLAVNLALIRAAGVDGAAPGAAANMILWNALLAFRVYRKLGFRPTALGRNRSRIICIVFCHG